jgi:hypothetical protein
MYRFAFSDRVGSVNSFRHLKRPPGFTVLSAVGTMAAA